jgi:hypothetical protein
MQPWDAGIAGQEDTIPRVWTTACEESMRCGCDLSLAGRKLYFMYAGGRKAKSAPQIAIPHMRLADTFNRLFFSS